MKGLRKYLSPFTPDQSGAVSVLYGYGGMLIIMDAGGCVGNICGYDEPRWESQKSAIFSAGLRDLDAILGRDELLIRKTRQALSDIDVNFVGLIGTPVPATIATDYRALKRLMEKDYGIPVLPVETNGMDLYDKGQSKAYLQLFGEFTGKDPEGESPEVGIIGATPLDQVVPDSYLELKRVILARGHDSAVVYGEGDSIADIRRAGQVKTNLVVSPSGLAAARRMESLYDIPYEVGYPIAHTHIRTMGGKIRECPAKRVLIIHQQVFANEIRKIVQAYSSPEAEEIDVASWFMMDEEIRQDNDAHLTEEDDLLRLVRQRNYDMIIGDPLLKRALPGWEGIWLDLPHYAVSGELHDSKCVDDYWQKAGERR